MASFLSPSWPLWGSSWAANPQNQEQISSWRPRARQDGLNPIVHIYFFGIIFQPHGLSATQRTRRCSQQKSRMRHIGLSSHNRHAWLDAEGWMDKGWMGGWGRLMGARLRHVLMFVLAFGCQNSWHAEVLWAWCLGRKVAG